MLVWWPHVHASQRIVRNKLYAAPQPEICIDKSTAEDQLDCIGLLHSQAFLAGKNILQRPPISSPCYPRSP